MPYKFPAAVLLSALAFGGAGLVAQETDAVAKDTDVESKLRKERLDTLVEVVSKLEVFSDVNGDALRTTEPLIRYKNPNRSHFSDGVMFALTEEDGLPRALVAASLRETGVLFLEVVSISDEPLASKLTGFGQWVPPVGGSGRRVSNLQPPAFEQPTRRLFAMRQIARTVAFKFETKEWADARLLSQPLYRFSAPERGIIDGAIFGYAEANDPEAVLMVWLEEGDEGKPGKWHWLAAASTSVPLQCYEGGMLRWEKGNFWKMPRKPSAPYVEFRESLRPELVPPSVELSSP